MKNNRRKFFISLIAVCSFIQLAIAQNHLDLKLNNGAVIAMNQKGEFIHVGPNLVENLLLTDSLSHLLRIKLFGDPKSYTPDHVSWKKKGAGYSVNLKYGKIKLAVSILPKQDYLSAEIIEVSPENQVELVEWGKLFTRMHDKVGLSIGVAYNDQLGIGLMGLNLKSLGGFEINHRERFGNTAQRLTNGAVLQAFTRNRFKERFDNNFIQELTNAVPVNDADASLIGSKIALYCVDIKKLPKLIAEIEQNEKLPYLTHGDEWIKTSLYSTTTKFIMSYNVRNIDSCLDLAERAGIVNVYHPGIFKSWGTYTLDSVNFPEGTKTIAKLSDKAAARNITLGAHTLTNFITTSDPLVTPVPHPNLQLAGVTTLDRKIDEKQNSIFLKANDVLEAYTKDEHIKQDKEYNVNSNKEIFAIKLGNEIIEYSRAQLVDGNIQLLDCKRGAFGTKAAVHEKGSRTGRLASHAYKVFFADINLQDTVAMNLAHFFNEGKLKRISFDGVEGGVATGHNRYGGERFVKVFFDHLEDKNIVANSSDIMHYAWHYLSNESWGEPWWAKSFKESQLDHRLAVQQALKEDFMPRKMGQFSIKDNTTAKDINWIMGLCAGYDAGVDFYISPNVVNSNPEGEEILAIIKNWETVRLAKGFSEDQKNQLRDVYSIYSLKGIRTAPELVMIETWAPEYGKLQQENERNTLEKSIFSHTDNTIVSFDYVHRNQQTEPGMPTHSEFKFYSVGGKQPLMFCIRVDSKAKHAVKGLYLKSGAQQIDIPFHLEAGDYVVLDQDRVLKHYDQAGKLKADQKISSTLEMNPRQNDILVDYQAIGNQIGPEITVNFKIEKSGSTIQ